MTICEYCGRVHQASEIDRRFCSLVCSTQYDQHPLLYQPDELLEEQRQQGQLLRTYLSALLQAAGQLRRQAETLSAEHQLTNLHGWLTTIAAQESQMLALSSIFDAPATPPPPPVPD